MRILFIGCCHIGGDSRADDARINGSARKYDIALIKYIKKQKADEVILGGDIKELAQFSEKKVNRKHKKILDYLDSIKTTWIIGNHDYKRIGYHSVTFYHRDGDVLAEHGHQSDKRMRNPLLRLFTWLLAIPECLINEDLDNPEKLKIMAKHYEKAKKNCQKYAEKKLKKGYRVVVLWHTHFQQKIDYFNGSMYINPGSNIHGEFHGAIWETDANKWELV